MERIRARVVRARSARRSSRRVRPARRGGAPESLRSGGASAHPAGRQRVEQAHGGAIRGRELRTRTRGAMMLVASSVWSSPSRCPISCSARARIASIVQRGAAPMVHREHDVGVGDPPVVVALPLRAAADRLVELVDEGDVHVGAGRVAREREAHGQLERIPALATAPRTLFTYSSVQSSTALAGWIQIVSGWPARSGQRASALSRSASISPM